jgi:hypothetical protein
VESFDWVKTRAACSFEIVFRELTEVIDSDVKRANSLNRPGLVFKVSAPADDKFIVSRTKDMSGILDSAVIVFELTRNEIKVRQAVPNPQAELFTAKPVLTANGKCLLEISGQTEPFELWQVSRKALDDLFFSV